MENEKIIIHKSKISSIIFPGLVALILLWIGFGAGLYLAGRNEVLADLAKKEVVYIGKLIGKYSEAKPGYLTQDIDFGLFWETWDALHKTFVDQEEISEKKLFYGALRGMVSSLGDPYTVFMEPQVAREFSEDLAGSFEGIGAEIGIKDDVLTIIAPLPDMPAEKAGLKAGDKVIMIDGESTFGVSIDEAVSRIRGPKNTEVILTIRRENDDGPNEITITRSQIVVKSVRTEMREDGLYLIKISNFNNDTKILFDQAINEILELDPAGIILDLRNNPGGYLETSIEIASEWVKDNIIVTERYGNNNFGDPIQKEHLSRGRPRLKDYPTVVLVNQGSASASEIVSGALQDYGLAEVVGMPTFGKGSVQSLVNLRDGSSIKITVAKWLTPLGRSINDEGIEPSHEIELDSEDYNANRDPQLDFAVSLLLGEEPELAEEAIETTEGPEEGEE